MLAFKEDILALQNKPMLFQCYTTMHDQNTDIEITVKKFQSLLGSKNTGFETQ